MHIGCMKVGYPWPRSWRTARSAIGSSERGGGATSKSDQYSLAISYAELRRDRRPFPARTNLGDARVDALESSPDVGDLSQPEKRVLLKALAKDPMDRYETCRDFAAALSAA